MQQLSRSRILRRNLQLCREQNSDLTPKSIARSYASKSASTSLRNQLHTPRRSAARPVQLLPVCHRRSFINIPNIFPNNNNNNTPENIRTLRASRTLPFPAAPLYEIIASVESYAEFLPFLAASTVTARDSASGFPSQAFLTVGYGPFTEKFTSRVNCDRSKWIVEARSGGGVGDDGKPIPGGDEGLFGYLSTKWELVPRPAGQQQQETEVHLEIRFRFQNPMHTAMMSAVEGQVAGVMIEAFERRIKEQMTLNR
jgi:coenzyme Q-binding protein COQ10